MALQFKFIRKHISQIWDIMATRKGKVDNSKLVRILVLEMSFTSLICSLLIEKIQSSKFSSGRSRDVLSGSNRK